MMKNIFNDNIKTILMKLFIILFSIVYLIIVINAIYLLSIQSTNITLIHYTFLTSSIILITLRPNIKDIYWYSTRIILPILFCYSIYFYMTTLLG